MKSMGSPTPTLPEREGDAQRQHPHRGLFHPHRGLDPLIADLIRDLLQL